jgi:hypothetical protein
VHTAVTLVHAFDDGKAYRRATLDTLPHMVYYVAMPRRTHGRDV